MMPLMNNIMIKHQDDVEGELVSSEGNRFRVKPIVDGADIARCAANIVEVEPGHMAYGYHYHEANEEVFYIIKGTASVRTPQGEVELPAGSVIGFPTSPVGAHVVWNQGTERLVYLDFGTRNSPDVVHFPDAQSGWAHSLRGVEGSVGQCVRYRFGVYA